MSVPTGPGDVSRIEQTLGRVYRTDQDYIVSLEPWCHVSIAWNPRLSETYSLGCLPYNQSLVQHVYHNSSCASMSLSPEDTKYWAAVVHSLCEILGILTGLLTVECPIAIA